MCARLSDELSLFGNRLKKKKIAIFFPSIQLSTRYLLNLKSITKQAFVIFFFVSLLSIIERKTIPFIVVDFEFRSPCADISAVKSSSSANNHQERILFVNWRNFNRCGVEIMILPQSYVLSQRLMLLSRRQPVHILIKLYSFRSFFSLPTKKFAFRGRDERHKWWSNFHNSRN